MPKPDTSNPIGGPSFQGPRYRPNWIAALLFFMVGAFLSVALLDYDPMQVGPPISTLATGKNLMGWVGAKATFVLLFSIGVSAWLLPVFLLWMLYVSVRNSKHLTGTRTIATVVACISLAGLAAMFREGNWSSNYYPHGYGGLIGRMLYNRFLEDALGTFGSGLILATLYAGALLMIFLRDIGSEFEKMFTNFSAWRADRARLKAEYAELRRKEKEARAKQKSTPVAVSAPPPGSSGSPLTVGPSGRKTFVPKSAEDPLAKTPAARAIDPPAPKADSKSPLAPKSTGTRPTSSTATDTKPLAAAVGKVELNIVKPEEPKKAAKITLPQSDDANYQFPPLALLKEQTKPAPGNSEEEHRQNAENLLRILSEFGVEVTLGEIHVGPVITRYEVVPAPGVRVEKIAGLDKNIALGMRAQSVRILAPIPGKAAVGVEVPNLHATPVGMRELLESEDWADMKSEIPIALGKDVSGKPLVSDLSKMPHLLIAGATGSGKSVCINSIVASILYSKSPKDLRLIMVDPKVVELKIFNALPHMLIPVVTEPKKVPAALKWLLGEMEQRYQIFARANVRNIVGFNNRKKGGKSVTPFLPEAQASLTGVDPAADEIEVPDRLPYIVAIIDELADLMMVASNEVEESIARLAQDRKSVV